GIVRAALEIASAQSRLGHEVTVATVGPDPWAADWGAVRLVTLAIQRWARLRVMRRSLDLSLHLPYLLFTRRHAIDVVHGHAYSYMRFLSARTRVVHFHSDPLDHGARNERLDLRPADFRTVRRLTHCQVAVSHSIAQQVIRGGADPSAVHVVHNGVDLARFRNEQWREAACSLRREWGVTDSDVVFLFAGATVPYKGVIHLARAFARMAASVSSAHLVLAGGGDLWGNTLAPGSLFHDYEAAVHSELQALVKAGRVHHLGKVAYG